ncbi:unnamed protein product [Soboliphyme baturini]|uniref:POT1PC domain-containing protein n=1 Tax=Soboliphyme baturini TaxID=241478 RepID=A0A183I9H2_9BILA|nr:unnamed protein product [Soboliphyme baturini]
MKAGEYANLIVQVVAVGQSRRSHGAVVLRVWDGTDPPADMRRINFEVEQLDIIQMAEELHKEVIDKTVDVFVYGCHRESALRLKPRGIVLLSNVHMFYRSAPASVDFSIHDDGAQFNRCIDCTVHDYHLIKRFAG